MTDEDIVSTDDLARQLAVLSALAKRINARIAQAKAELGARMSPGESKRALHPDDDHVELGTISMSVGPRRAAVTNEIALSMWVAEHHPEQMISTVDPDYVARILETSKAVNRPCTPEGDLDVPGVAVTQGEPVLRVLVPKLPDAVWRGLIAEAAREVTA